VTDDADAEFAEFFNTNRDQVIKLITATTGDRERAVDATQEAFIKAHERWDIVRTYASPAGWVRRVAINASNDDFRSQQRRQRREFNHSDSPAPSLDDAVVGDAFAKALLEQLPQRQREVAALFYIDDRSVAEIAAILEVNEGTVKSNLSDARERLRGVLSDDVTPL
jgi:RNA polymerase sigma-70 factor (ECF subfamily)